jgi:hypothetical protein
MSARSRLWRLVLVIACVTLVRGGWTPAEAAPCRTPDPAAEARANLILAGQRPFAPTNRDFFYTNDNPAWADVAPLGLAVGPAPSERETRDALQAFLARRFSCAPERVQEGMSLYRDPLMLEKVPDPTLRAAMVALLGTVAEPAIEFALQRTSLTRIEFGIYVNTSIGVPDRVGGTYAAPDGTHFIEIDRHYRYLPFAALSPLVAHEILHTGDDKAGMAEETVASAVEALVYMEMLLTDPTLARLPDALTRTSNNHAALVRLNSGPAGTNRLTLFVPGSTVSIDPLAVDPLTEFNAYYASYSAPDEPGWRELETPGNWLLWRILERLAEPGSTVPADGAGFDAATLAFIDANQAVLSPAELVAVACILELDLPCD